jgi:hypothetical protein
LSKIAPNGFEPLKPADETGEQTIARQYNIILQLCFVNFFLSDLKQE